MTLTKRILLASPHMSDEGYEEMYVKEAFDTNWIAPLGKNVDQFEKELCEKVKINEGVALNSGTAAIHLALKAAGIKKNEKVFCSTFTFSATVNPIIYEGAIPVFIESDEKTWNMCPEALEKAFIQFPEVKIVVLVHLYGLSADMDKILAICKKYNAVLIEDAAESLGSLYKGKQTGTFGEYGIFSFNGNKIITTSGGGILVSNNKQKIDKARFWATQSRDQAVHYEHSEIGYNYRLSNILAGVGRGQLKVLDDRVNQKKKIFEAYKSELNVIDEITFMPINKWDNPNCWLTCITLNSEEMANKIQNALSKGNIESRPLWKPMHIQPIFKQYEYVGDNLSVKLFKTGLCLPSDTNMSLEDVKKVCAVIKNTINKSSVGKYSMELSK